MPRIRESPAETVLGTSNHGVLGAMGMESA